MSDFISREAAIKLFNFAVLDCLGMEPTIRASDVIKALESIPTADVREVVRGKWVDDKGEPVSWDEFEQDCPAHSSYCSVCGDWLSASDEYPVRGRFCPNCGAKMEES